MNWNLYWESRRHCRPALYRDLYFGWRSYNRQIFPGVEFGPCGAGTAKTAIGPGAGSGGGNCVPPEPGMGGKPPPNWRSLLNKYLNVNTGRLLEAYKVVYENRTSHKPPHPADLHGRNRVTATLVTAVTVKTGFPNHRCHRSNCRGRQKFNYCRKGLHFGTPFFVAGGPYPHVALHFACVPIGIIHSQIVLLNTINYFLDGIRLGILDIGIAYKNGTGSMGFHPHCWVDNNPFRVSSPSHGNCTVRSDCTPGLL